MKRYTLIGIYAVWREGKTHISKEVHEVNSLCGRHLGFDYGVVSVDGIEGGQDLLLTKEEIIIKKGICKKCLKKLNNL